MKRAGFSVVLTALALASAACDTARTVAPATQLARADTPAGAVRVLESAFNRSDVDAVDGLLPDDWQMLSSSQDSAGSETRIPWGRDSMLVALRSMFQGVPGVSGPAMVNLTLDHNLVLFPDPRPGKEPRVHKSIRSAMNLRIMDPVAGSFEVQGYLLFFFTRGDSVALSPERLAQGARPDTTRWWIGRLEDESLGPVGAGGRPARNFSFLDVLRFYRERTLH